MEEDPEYLEEEDPINRLIRVMQEEEVSRELKIAIMEALDQLKFEARCAWTYAQKQEGLLEAAYIAEITRTQEEGVESLSNEEIRAFANIEDTIH